MTTKEVHHPMARDNISESELPMVTSEPHSNNTRYLHDFVLGFADGLTVPFALTTGFSALGSQRLVIIGGVAELLSGAISMGLGAYLAALTDRQTYANELRREKREVEEVPTKEKEEIYEILCRYGPSREEVSGFVESLCRDHKDGWIQFMMDIELKLEKPLKRHAVWSAVVMGLAYALGGLFPMLPYFAMRDVHKALFISIGIAIFVLLVFGFLKSRLFGGTATQATVSALSTLVIGAVAAAVSYGIVRGINSASW